MKKILITAAIVAGMVSANAQDIRFGAKAGLNIANASMEPKWISQDENGKDFTIGTEAIYAYHFGGVAEMKFSDKLAAQVELLYSAQGYAINDNTNKDEKISLLAKRNYINIPVMLKYQVIEGLNVEFGPQVGILLGATTTLKHNGEDPSKEDKEDSLEELEEIEKQINDWTDSDIKEIEEEIKGSTKEDIKKETRDGGGIPLLGSILKPKDYIKSIDFGLNFGASYDITENINVGARYYMGLIDTRKQSANYKKYEEMIEKATEENIYIKNSNIQVSLTYFF